MSSGAGQNPLVSILRFGFAPQGSSSGTGTDFRHEPHILMGLPTHMVRFGFSPLNSPPPAGGGEPTHPTPFGSFHNFGRMGSS